MADLTSHGPELVKFARAYLREALGGPKADRPAGTWTGEPGATFVTLRWHDGGDLQGCIGTIRPHRAIVDDVASNAVAAATRDSRGQRLSLADVDQLDVELSILSPLEAVPKGTEREMWKHITPGTHGVLLETPDTRGVLLPVVWDRLSLSEFAAALKAKAGLPPTFWSADVSLFRYTVEHHVDNAPARG
jgi:hypothetical protein